MGRKEFDDRVRMIAQTTPGLTEYHLAELVASDPVLRLAPYLAMVETWVEDGILERTDTKQGPVLSAVAQAKTSKG